MTFSGPSPSRQSKNQAPTAHHGDVHHDAERQLFGEEATANRSRFDIVSFDPVQSSIILTLPVLERPQPYHERCPLDKH
jgi:hypothetical protein